MWDTTWDQGYGYEEIDGLVIKDDGIYVAGWTEGETTQMDVVLHKLDFNGNFLWTQIWGSNGFDQSDGHMVVDDSVIYIAGRYNGINEIFGGDALLAAFDRVDGNYKWHTTWGGSAMDDALGMAGDDDYLYQVGITGSFTGNKIFILKYDKAGVLQWDTLWGDSGAEKARAITVGDDGYIYIGVNTSSYGAGSDDIALLKCSPDGDPLWYKTWGGAQAEAVHDIVVRNGFAYLTGSTVSYSSNIFPDALLLKAPIDLQSISVEHNPDNQQLHLYQNFPNPSSDITTISFSIPQDAFVTLKVVDLLGREINVLVNKKLSKGKHSMTLNLDSLKEGIYFYLLKIKNRRLTKKLIRINR